MKKSTRNRNQKHYQTLIFMIREYSERKQNEFKYRYHSSIKKSLYCTVPRQEPLRQLPYLRSNDVRWGRRINNSETNESGKKRLNSVVIYSQTLPVALSSSAAPHFPSSPKWQRVLRPPRHFPVAIIDLRPPQQSRKLAAMSSSRATSGAMGNSGISVDELV